MPRKARIDAPGTVHHIIIRGIERRSIFRDDPDRERFLDRLGAVLLESRTSCFAWVLIRNHVHLLLRSGSVPLATVMRRLLTGYAMYFNRRYRRHGQLFQNRYKSILCEEDLYLKELARYIHLNPLRAKVVEDLNELQRYRFCGHGAVLGEFECCWLDDRYVLSLFATETREARRRYEDFVAKGIGQGRRKDLVGGGLLRSAGGWEELKRKRKSGERIKGDERILGGSDFVLHVLAQANEKLSRRTITRTMSVDFKGLMQETAMQSGISARLLSTPTKERAVSRARAALCHKAIRLHMMSVADVARALNLSPSMVSRAVRRAEKMGWAGAGSTSDS